MNIPDGFRAALAELDGGLVAIDARRAPGLLPIVSELASGRDVSDARLAGLVRPSSQAASARSGIMIVPAIGGGGTALAVVPMHGVALYDLDYQPYCFSTAKLAATVAELANDKKIGKIVLDINTPGGQVTGTQEAADAVFLARKKKPVIGIVNALCASAGYWIGSQCTKLIGVPSADVGSIGVFMAHSDYSALLAKAGVKPTLIYAGEHKTEGNSMEPLSDKAKEWFQSEVDGTYRQFLRAVALGRGTDSANVKDRFGGGRCFGATMAKSVGMIDEIATPERALISVATAKMVAATLSPNQISAERRRRLIAMQEAQ